MNIIHVGMPNMKSFQINLFHSLIDKLFIEFKNIFLLVRYNNVSFNVEKLVYYKKCSPKLMFVILHDKKYIIMYLILKCIETNMKKSI
jgi:hypothetical protein